MQKNLRGGYQLISLGMVALVSITKLPLDVVNEIIGSKKRIVLTDISLDGVKQEPDIGVQIKKDGSDIIIENVYGKTLTIDSTDGDVTITNYHGGGVTLYLHHIVMVHTDPDDNDWIEVLSPIKETFDVKADLWDGKPVFVGGNLEVAMGNPFALTGSELLYLDGGEITSYNMPNVFVSDTVTKYDENI